MLRVSVETQSEFDSKRGNDKATDYVRTEIPGVCEVWYKPASQSVIIVKPDEDNQEANP